jgi:hypothetical protein
MSSSIRPRALFSADSAYPGALETWRDAEAGVRACWDAFRSADRPSRRRAAFAAYMTALDAEAAAADALADSHVELAAAA